MEKKRERDNVSELWKKRIEEDMLLNERQQRGKIEETRGERDEEMEREMRRADKRKQK